MGEQYYRCFILGMRSQSIPAYYNSGERIMARHGLHHFGFIHISRGEVVGIECTTDHKLKGQKQSRSHPLIVGHGL